MNKVEKTEVELVNEIEVLGVVERGANKSRIVFEYLDQVYVALVSAEAEEIDQVYELARALIMGNYGYATEEDIDVLEEREHELCVKDIVGFLYEDSFQEFWVVKWYTKDGKEAYYVVFVGWRGLRGEALVRGIRASMNSGDKEMFKLCGDREVSKAKANGCMGRFNDPVKAGFKVTRNSVYKWFREPYRSCVLSVLGKFYYINSDGLKVWKD
jgi:hypothetical protein